jgi:hypothetical protein
LELLVPACVPLGATRRTEEWRRKQRSKPRAGANRIARASLGQKYEVDYEAKKARKSAGAVKKAVATVGNSRKKVESVLTARVLANRKRRAKVASKR